MREETLRRFLLLSLSAAAAGGIFYLSFRYLLPWCLPFLLAALIASLLEPIVLRWQRTLHFRRGFSSLVLTLTLLFLLGGLLSLLWTTLLSQMSAMLSAAPVFFDALPEAAEGLLARVVFCGYGEPAERLKDLLEVAAWLKKNYTVKTRINTNGLADLIWGEPTAPWLEGKIDAVSISLNAIDAEEYLRLTRSKFGIGSYDAMLKYTHECTKYVPTVMMTVVDQVTTPEEQESARKICEKLGVNLRVRPFES